jgi:hypothetical protein
LIATQPRGAGKNGTAPRPEGRGAECSVVQFTVFSLLEFWRAVHQRRIPDLAFTEH